MPKKVPIKIKGVITGIIPKKLGRFWAFKLAVTTGIANVTYYRCLTMDKPNDLFRGLTAEVTGIIPLQHFEREIFVETIKIINQ